MFDPCVLIEKMQNFDFQFLFVASSGIRNLKGAISLDFYLQFIYTKRFVFTALINASISFKIDIEKLWKSFKINSDFLDSIIFEKNCLQFLIVAK